MKETNTFYGKQIMDRNTHLFVFSDKPEERESFLQAIEEDYPVQNSNKKPMAVRLKDFSLPTIENNDESLDLIRLKTISRGHLAFSIAEKVTDRINREIELNKLNIQIELLLNKVNSVCLSKDFESIKDIKGLIIALKKAKLFYEEYYINYMKRNAKLPKISNLPITYLEPTFYINLLRQTFDDPSYFGLLFDVQNPIPNLTKRTINSLIKNKCNQDMSMKIVTAPNEWGEYHDLSGGEITPTKDYGIVTCNIGHSYRR